MFLRPAIFPTTICSAKGMKLASSSGISTQTCVAITNPPFLLKAETTLSHSNFRVTLEFLVRASVRLNFEPTVPTQKIAAISPVVGTARRSIDALISRAWSTSTLVTDGRRCCSQKTDSAHVAVRNKLQQSRRLDGRLIQRELLQAVL